MDIKFLTVLNRFQILSNKFRSFLDRIVRAFSTRLMELPNFGTDSEINLPIGYTDIWKDVIINRDMNR